MKVLLVILVVALLATACAPTSTASTKDGADTVGAGDAAAAAAQTPKQCKETIDYKILVAALPSSVAGFSPGGEPEGSTLSWADPTNPDNQVKYSTASVSLQKDDQSVQVTIMDTCYVSFLGAGWYGFAEYEGTSGSLKKTTIAGNPGWKQVTKSGDTTNTNIIVFVKNRVLVSVDGNDGVSEGNLEAIANAIDFAKIASAANG